MPARSNIESCRVNTASSFPRTRRGKVNRDFVTRPVPGGCFSRSSGLVDLASDAASVT